MIIDCFLFYNELDLLEIRLNELSPYVDKFLIVESRHTFQGDPKPLHFFQNLPRFEKFKGRIIHVVPADLPQGKNYEHGWERERASRDAIVKGLEGLPDDAIIMLSDLDEIPNLVGWDPDREVPACWSHQLYYYYVDLEVCPIKGTVAVPLRTFLKNPEIQGLGSKLREWRHYNPRFVFEGNRGGWHFSYLGGADAIQKKILAFSHAELNPHATKENIRKALEESWKNGIDLFNRDIYQFKHVKDGDLPRFLLDNRERFAHFWMPDKLPLPCGLKELPETSPVEEMREIVAEEELSIDTSTWDSESPNVVDSGPIVLGMVHDTLSDMVQGGYFKCASSEEPGASAPEESGSSGNEKTEQSLSSPLDEILEAYMRPAVESIAGKIEGDLLDLYQGFESERQQKAKLPSDQMIFVEENIDMVFAPKDLGPAVDEPTSSIRLEVATTQESASKPRKIRACSTCGIPVFWDNGDVTYSCQCGSGWSWANAAK